MIWNLGFWGIFEDIVLEVLDVLVGMVSQLLTQGGFCSVQNYCNQIHRWDSATSSKYQACIENETPWCNWGRGYVYIFHVAPRIPHGAQPGQVKASWSWVERLGLCEAFARVTNVRILMSTKGALPAREHRKKCRNPLSCLNDTAMSGLATIKYVTHRATSWCLLLPANLLTDQDGDHWDHCKLM